MPGRVHLHRSTARRRGSVTARIGRERGGIGREIGRPSARGRRTRRESLPAGRGASRLLPMLKPARATRGPEPDLQKPATALYVRGGYTENAALTGPARRRARGRRSSASGANPAAEGPSGDLVARGRVQGDRPSCVARKIRFTTLHSPMRYASVTTL